MPQLHGYLITILTSSTPPACSDKALVCHGITLVIVCYYLSVYL